MGFLMGVIKKYADNTKADSMAAQLRRKRFALFESLLAQLPCPVRILDVGGEQHFWEVMGYTSTPGIQVVILNLSKAPITLPNFVSVAGDATDMVEYKDGEFDVAFSNSVIEHVGTFEQQARMAREVQRVGERYFVQTPNRYFPIEPHFLFPYFQFLPFRLRAMLAYRFRLGWYGAQGDQDAVTESVRSIRLLTKRELKQIFPGATIRKEKLLGLTKSFMVYGGWN